MTNQPRPAVHLTTHNVEAPSREASSPGRAPLAAPAAVDALPRVATTAAASHQKERRTPSVPEMTKMISSFQVGFPTFQTHHLPQCLPQLPPLCPLSSSLQAAKMHHREVNAGMQFTGPSQVVSTSIPIGTLA